ncbi:MAG TPA: DUF3883 domain-containing protein [Fluviicola sp.]|nr:DUF3883 domain-containing protein [Fluviicola sp.]
MSAWTNIECELIVADYFRMLSMELTGVNYNKAAHRRNLQPLLHSRSDGSIEFKHQNISAVLIRLGQPYIKGYLPRFNIQQLLAEKVIEYLHQHQSIEQQFKLFSESPEIITAPSVDFDKWRVNPPETTEPKVPSDMVNEQDLIYLNNPIKTNYLEREQQNSKLGELGEELVLEYERWQLKKLGKDRLAKQVTWVSKDNDRAGYDILSRNVDGSEKYIEVKTTKLGKETPFFFSKGELLFSQRSADDYHLCRVFNVATDAKIFSKQGRLDVICQSEAIGFKGWF